MVGFQKLKILTRKAMKKMFLSFTDKIKANLKQKLASRIRNEKLNQRWKSGRVFRVGFGPGSGLTFIREIGLNRGHTS